MTREKSWKASVVLEYVYSDVAGPFLVPSFGKARYVLTFIDDFSRYTWVFFLLIRVKYLITSSPSKLKL